jgi:hypothetical protein
MLSGEALSTLAPMTVVKNPLLRVVLMTLGWLWVGIAFVGVLVPVLPTTGPILLAAFLFSKSSERFDHWLLTNRFFGGIVYDWRSGNGFTVRAKVVAVGAILASFGITTIWFVTAPYARFAMWLLAASIATFVVTRPTKTRGMATERVSA